MPAVALTPALESEYQLLFATCQVRSSFASEVESIINKIKTNRDRYANVSEPLGVPWYVTAIIHSLEAGLSFTGHLHNGDPLDARTKQVPIGRPKTGEPPFTWEESARDALVYDGMTGWKDWSIQGTLYRFESYNGFGYRLQPTGIFSPYLWSYSNHYSSGKFIKDGIYSETAVSKQCGAAVLLRRMAERKLVNYDAGGKLIKGAEADKKPFLKYLALVKYSKTAKSGTALELQNALNKVPGIFVKPDGVPGDRTSEAFKRVTGKYLIGDSRT